MFEELKQMNAELETLKKDHLERSKAMFTKVTSLLFDKHPALESFGWNQYTPYFNDGDECVFSANTSYPKINGDDADEMDYDKERVTDYGAKEVNGSRPQKKNEHYNPALAAAQTDVEEFLENIDDSVLRDLFGDHVEVTVTKEGTSVDEYEHD